MRNKEDSTLEEPLIHISIWIRNNIVINEEYDEAEGSGRSLPMKQIKIIIQFSFDDIVLLCICLYSVDVFVTSKCIHLCILYIVTRCLFRDVSIMYLSHVVIPRCSDWEDK